MLGLEPLNGLDRGIYVSFSGDILWFFGGGV
jgi:hypothetical protein